MFEKLNNDRRKYLEFMLVLIALVTTCLFYKMEGYKMVVLHLFYLPIVLSGFFLGRYHSGVLAMFCVISASVAAAFSLTGFASHSSVIIVAMALAVWAGTLGLTGLLVGTLSDDRAAKMKELHEAYVEIAEVLSRYLQSANPRLKARSTRIAELSQMVAVRMNLSPMQIDSTRVAALLYDIGKIEITTKIISKVVDALQDSPEDLGQDTFQGADLIHSLSVALSPDILPLLDPEGVAGDGHAGEEEQIPADIPIGAKIIRTVRAYDDLTEGGLAGPIVTPSQAVGELRGDIAAGHDREVLNALEHSVSQTTDRVAIGGILQGTQR